MKLLIKTDDFKTIMDFLHAGQCRKLKLVWSFSWWRWMYHAEVDTGL